MRVVILQGHRYLEHPILGVQSVCVSTVDIPTPRTHTSNSVQSGAPGPITTLQLYVITQMHIEYPIT
jgi:hypothetical protein